MNILVACEESQKVCIQFRLKGHNAFSCDIQECSGGHPEWHIHGDVLPLLNGNCSFETMNGDRHFIEGKWDMIIAFPPCTHLALSGAQHFDKKREDGRQREGIEFFCQFFKADCDRVCIENPNNVIMGGNYVKQYYPDLCETYGLPRKQSQTIQPWMFGDRAQKTTCLWLKGLPLLIPEITESPMTDDDYKIWTNKKGQQKRVNRTYFDKFLESGHGKYPDIHHRLRSETYDGIARAMAEQWNSVENYVEKSNRLF